jgi:hypothetical protein
MDRASLIPATNRDAGAQDFLPIHAMIQPTEFTFASMRHRHGLTLTLLSLIGSVALFTAAALSVVGCNGQPSLLPNSDTSLRKESTAFAADAARRQYPAQAPRVANAPFRAEVGYMLKQFDVANIGTNDWNNVEVWVNRKYVVFVPKYEAKTDKTLNFQMFFDADGNHFDTNGGANPVKSLELCYDGKIYPVITQLSD